MAKPVALAAVNSDGKNGQEDASATYAESLERWELYDCNAFVNERSDSEMKTLFVRLRATRGKPVTVTATVILQPLDKAWTSYVHCRNNEGGDAFERVVVAREEAHPRLSVGGWPVKSADWSVIESASAVQHTGKTVVSAVASAASRDPTKRNGAVSLRLLRLLK
ncbi:hypothetical protein PInf_009808 [Phytophthora infestans]|nr:hypothetical protein PInf_009808 [Phytophthora infestans]